ncbi:MAG: N-acetyltransferase family protein [Thermoleophilia bacterium]
MESEQVIIRPVTPDDAEAVCAILDAAIVDGRHSLLDTPFSADEERRYISAFPCSGVFMVADLPVAGVVGFQSLEPYASYGTHAFDHVLTVGTYVHESYRRRGLGRLLAAACFEAARRSGCRRVLTEIRGDNDASLRFYLALGFGVVGVARDLARLGGRFVDVVIVERVL